MIFGQTAVAKSAFELAISEPSFMDMMIFLKLTPAVIGVAGLLTYFVRARKPESDLELVNIVQRVRNTFLLVGCAALIMLSVWLIRRPAPPDHDTVSPLAYHGAESALKCRRRDLLQCRVRQPHVEDFGCGAGEVWGIMRLTHDARLAAS